MLDKVYRMPFLKKGRERERSQTVEQVEKRVPHITGRLDTTSVSKKKGKIELRVITKV